MSLPTKIIEAPLRLLGEYSIDCVIVGGVAAVIHGSLRLTNDIDVCYSRDPANLKRLADALQLEELEAIQEAQKTTNPEDES